MRPWILLALCACSSSSEAPADGSAPPPDAAPDVAVDPCAACAPGATCDAAALTSNKNVCSCPAGYAGDGTTAGTGCTDIDECAVANDCDDLACVNTAGNYQCEGLYAIEPFENVFARLHPETFALLDSTPLTGGTFNGVTALAVHPTTGVVYAVAKSAGTRQFGTIDLATARFDSIAAVPRFSSMSFGPNGVLYALTGAGGSPAKTLHTVNLTTGEATVVGPMTGGSDGAVICFNPDDSLMYYWVGSSSTMQSFAVSDPSTRTQISANIGVGEVFGCKYVGNNTFLVHDIQSRVRYVTTAGAVSTVPNAVSNLFQDVRATVRAPMAPHAVRPKTGDIAGGETVTLRGMGLMGATAVKFGGVDAASFTVIDDTTLTAVAPAGAAGVVDISVQASTQYPSMWRAAYSYVDPNATAKASAVRRSDEHASVDLSGARKAARGR